MVSRIKAKYYESKSGQKKLFAFCKDGHSAAVSTSRKPLKAKLAPKLAEIFRLSSWVKENSAIREITGFDKDKVTKNKIYGISHTLYQEKDPLEQYFSRQTNELFDLEDKIILYDLTSANWRIEGRLLGGRIARFGYMCISRSSLKAYYKYAPFTRKKSVVPPAKI